MAALLALPRDGHLEALATLTRAAPLTRVSVELPHEDRSVLSDVESAQRVLTSVVLVLRDTPQVSYCPRGPRPGSPNLRDPRSV